MKADCNSISVNPTRKLFLVFAPDILFRAEHRFSKLFLEMLFLFWALEPKFRSKLCFAQLFFSLV